MKESGHHQKVERQAAEPRRPRASRGAKLWSLLIQDFRYALRGVYREPGFATVIVLTLALGVAANATMFGITDRLLLRAPAHIVDPDRVAPLGFAYRDAATGEVSVSVTTTYADYMALRENVSGFSEVGAWSFAYESPVGRGESAKTVRIMPVTASFFEVLGVRPAHGIFFTEAHDTPPQGERVAVLSYSYWQQHLGGSEEVLGANLEIEGETYAVLGVAPEDFTGLDLRGADVWLPVSAIGASRAYNSTEWHTARNNWWLRPVARLASGVSRANAAAEATVVDARNNPAIYEDDPSAAVVLGSAIPGRGVEAGLPPEARQAGGTSGVALWLLGVSGVVLLIACANVANLLLARAVRRRQEIGVRAALGAGRGRLAAQAMSETFALVMLAAALGVLLALWGGEIIRDILIPDVEWQDTLLGGRMLLWSSLILSVVVLLAGMAPALLAARMDPSRLLRSGARQGIAPSRTRSALVVVQSALCVVLLIGAALFSRSLQSVRDVPLGFDVNQVISLTWDAGAMGLSGGEERAELYEQARERLSAVPGVRAVALTTTTSEPFTGRITVPIRVPGLDSLPRAPGGGPYYASVPPEYFRVMQMSIVRGRGFTEEDRVTRETVIVTPTLARLLWPGEDPLGKCMHIGPPNNEPPCSEVIGVTSDVRMLGVTKEPSMSYFVPLLVGGTGERTLLVRTDGRPQEVIPRLRRALLQVRPDMPYIHSIVLRERIEPETRPWRLGATLFVAFGILSLIVASMGLYAVIAYDVAQRRRELAIRAALGASLAQVFSSVLAKGARFALLGIGIGTAAAFLLSGRIEPLLFAVNARDPIIYASVAAVLISIAIVAGLGPARRAARVEPAEALQSE